MGTFTFKWPHDAEEVYVTGDFDDWSKSEKLEKVGQVFQKTVTLPNASDKIYYKFVVDGEWTTDHTAPQEKDLQGNDNNVLLLEQMEKGEKTAATTALNSAHPDSTTTELAGAVPLEEKKEEAGDATLAKAVVNSAAPDSSSAQLAGAVPLEEKKEENVEKDVSPPGGYPETPAAGLEQEVKVDPLPAAEGAVNPIKLGAGETIPKEISVGAIDSHVTLDKESYEKSDRIPGIDTELPPVTGNMIPESSLPVVAADEVTINTVGPESTTAALAGQVPLEEPKVPEIVKQSQEKAHVDPEASAISEEVREKAEVEEELLDKVPEAPSTSEGTSGKGTEKSETDVTAAETVVAAAATAGSVALGAAIAATEGASGAVADLATKATAVATDAATNLPGSVKAALPESVQESITEDKKEAVVESVSPEVPAEVKESLKEAAKSPEAAANTTAVEEKKEVEAELLKVVKSADGAGESSTPAAVEKDKPLGDKAVVEEPQIAEVPKLVEETETSKAEKAEKAETVQTAQAVEPPHAAEPTETVSEAMPVVAAQANDAPPPAAGIRLVEDIKPVEPSEAAEGSKIVEPPKAMDEPEATEVSKVESGDAAKSAVEEPSAAGTVVAEPATATTNGTTTAAATTSTGVETNGNKTADGQASVKKKNRISGFFAKLKHKFA
ncbi:Cruciform DNA-recognizing protein 1 [Madurella mycetomatis]|uniref:Cruciform DNA-recognizing protein 1 n=1 Tax=Madurella mycetomatis TaxID=100816 RepID=A0A175W4E6_9PEZI|nr:Cruciform DNA-recognizing protein 1 [Madurella mycetomatis]